MEQNQKIGKAALAVVFAAGLGWLFFEAFYLEGETLVEREVEMNGEPVAIELETSGEPLALEVDLGSPQGQQRVGIELESPDGEKLVSRPGLTPRKGHFLTDFVPPQAGTYRVSLQEHELLDDKHASSTVRILAEDRRVMMKLLDYIPF